MSNKKQMKYNAERSVSGCNYVLRHTSLDYFMRGDVHVVKSKALNLLGRTSESLSELHEALKYKKSEEVAFSLISDAYKKMGNKKKALEVVTEGLRSYPESNNLKKRYTDLGGTQPYPEPFATNKQAGSKEKTENQKFTTEAAPKVIAPSDDVDKIIEQSSENISPPYKEIEKKIGSKDNPFCRFCPDQDSAQLKQQP
jgi:tetratricopeptide (TPR) repeat protein